MITGFSHVTCYVLDQERAKRFYTEQLGFTLTIDVTMGDGFSAGGQGFRWLTVSTPDDPDLEIVLADPRMGNDEESAAAIRMLVAKGALGVGVLATDDVRATYETLSARGVEFLQEPAERPYGVEAILRDDSGNWFSLTQRVRTTR